MLVKGAEDELVEYEAQAKGKAVFEQRTYVKTNEGVVGMVTKEADARTAKVELRMVFTVIQPSDFYHVIVFGVTVGIFEYLGEPSSSISANPNAPFLTSASVAAPGLRVTDEGKPIGLPSRITTSTDAAIVEVAEATSVTSTGVKS